MAHEQENSIEIGIPWQVEELRITAFHTPAAELATAADWENILNQPPAQILDKPREGMLRCEGPFANGSLSLMVQPDRTHWRYVASTGPDDETRVPVIGTYPECINDFTPQIKNWIASRANIKRLAFGAKLNHPVEDQKEGCQLLDRVLPAVEVDPESLDFQYRVNRRRFAELDNTNYLINRLSKWCVMTWHMMILIPSQGSLPSRGGSVKHACTLDVDINTDAERDEELPTNALPLLFDELISQAKEIVQDGDKK